MSLFNYDDYKRFVLDRTAEKPRGEMQRLAARLRMHPTAVSQVFKGDRDLNLEQAAELAEYLDLTEAQSQYLLLLVTHAKAGSQKLRKLLRGRIDAAQKQSRQIASRMPQSKAFTEGDRAIFYSTWQYSAARLLTTIPRFRNVSAVAQELGLSGRVVGEIFEFLVSKGLCQEKNGEIHVGPQRTHVAATSPMALRHHSNWRLKALESHARLDDEHELAFTAPLSLKVSDCAVLRRRLVDFIEETTKFVADSPAETLACLNVDWFRVRRT